MKFSINHKSENNEFKINGYYGTIESNLVLLKSKTFKRLCEVGCKNYNKKYSCPPHSPVFEIYCTKYTHIHVLTLKLDTIDYPKRYNTIRMINVVLKSIQRKMFDRIDIELNDRKIDHKILENGSCRLCKKCNLQLNLPCKHPLKMRPSLEATGVDVNQLTIACFGLPLQWYTKDNFPEYQCVVGGVLSTFENNQLIENVFENLLHSIQLPQY